MRRLVTAVLGIMSFVSGACTPKAEEQKPKEAPAADASDPVDDVGDDGDEVKVKDLNLLSIHGRNKFIH